MPSNTNVLDEARDLVQKRLAELDEERKRLERALGELGGKIASRPGRRPGRPRGSSRPSKGSAPRRRRKGTRADQAVALVESSPGISASEIAKTMKIKPNYLYRVLGDLEKEKRVQKKGRKYFPASASASDSAPAKQAPAKSKGKRGKGKRGKGKRKAKAKK